MKRFEPFEIEVNQCRSELAALKDLLAKFERATLKERDDVLSFFRDHRHVAALAGYSMPNIVRVDRLAYEFDFFGDYAADVAVGDSKRGAYCFIEFENAAPDSIFVKAGKKSSLEWATRFDKGYSQIIDWFWKLHDMAGTSTAKARFDNRDSIDYYALLVIGRSRHLKPLEFQRLEWRRQKVIIDSRRVHCLTFDEFYEDLAFKLERYAPAETADDRTGAAK
jgi:Domain of unknown function (DUF4263)